MLRRRITQIFPFLLPLRKKQRIFCFYQQMKIDKNIYASRIEENTLPYLVFSYEEEVINKNSGYDICYQENKLHNLKMAAQTIHHLILKPNEVFSYYHTQQFNPYQKQMKEGLCVVDEEMHYVKGGGVCQLSNMLYYLALNSPLTVLERHSHTIQMVANSIHSLPLCDATLVEGWCDLKLKNNTDQTLQIVIRFESSKMEVALYSNCPQEIIYHAEARNTTIHPEGQYTIYENDIYKQYIDKDTNGLIKEEFITHNLHKVMQKEVA